MTKTELIDKMAEDAGISKAAANKALDLSVDTTRRVGEYDQHIMLLYADNALVAFPPRVVSIDNERFALLFTLWESR